MDYTTVIIIAVALAMDAFSVCISAGICIPKPNTGHYLRLAGTFGLFQFMMPIIGYFAGAWLEQWIENYDHWVAFAMLAFIGVKMISESLQPEEEGCEPRDPSRGGRLVLLAIATSIDALAVGLSIGVLRKPIFFPSIIIGVICAAFSIIGIAIGNRVSSFVGKRAESVGGVLLIAIGVKILIEHMR